MGNVVAFPRRLHLIRPPVPSFIVKVLQHDGLWFVVSRDHSWDFPSRSLAQRFAREIADGFGVSTVVQMRGVAC